MVCSWTQFYIIYHTDFRNGDWFFFHWNIFCLKYFCVCGNFFSYSIIWYFREYFCDLTSITTQLITHQNTDETKPTQEFNPFSLWNPKLSTFFKQLSNYCLTYLTSKLHYTPPISNKQKKICKRKIYERRRKRIYIGSIKLCRHHFHEKTTLILEYTCSQGLVEGLVAKRGQFKKNRVGTSFLCLLAQIIELRHDFSRSHNFDATLISKLHV